MTISILIAAYEAGNFLPAALAGIADQSHLDWELVVVEDGSHDQTEELIRDFADQVSQKVRYENLGINRGVAAARNRLLELAEGDAVAFLDADDIWLPEHLSSVAKCLAEGHAIACTPVYLWDGDNQRPMGSYQPTSHQVSSPLKELYRISFIWTSTCVALSRETVDRVGYFDETLKIGEDRDYWFRALEGGHTLGCTDEATCRYTKHAGSSMTKTIRVASDAVAFYRKHFNTPSLDKSFRKAVFAEALWIYGRLVRSTDKKLAKSLFFETVKNWPFNPRYWVYLFV